MIFRARQFEFRFPRPVLVMGIVNVTPDSFFDGGNFFGAEAAVKHALKLVEQGAEILDIGGESTRPNAQSVGETEELRRVIPVIEKIVKVLVGVGRDAPPRVQADRQVSPTRPVLISIDTMKPAVALAALEAGASIVNDVAANRKDGAMWKVVSEYRAGYVCMHAKKGPVYENIVREVGEFFQGRLKKLKAFGIAPEQIVFDPGIGFGKTLEQNLQLLANVESFTKLHRPLLLGASRKSFIEKIFGAKVNERLPASLACAILAAESGAQIIRTHDVAETVQAVRMAEVILTRKE
jgi:dihydropteroate synthase